MRNFSLKTKGNSSPRSSYRRFVTLFLVCVGVLLFLAYARTAIVWFGGLIVTPFYTVEEYLKHSSATIPVFIRDRLELQAEIDTLKQEIESQKGIQGAFQYIEKENIELRNLLKATTSESVLAGVVARPPQVPYDLLVIDQGSSNGLFEGAPVLYGSGNALGYIEKVFSHHAFVTLFSSPGIETTVYVFGPNIFTTAYGDGGGVIYLSIPQGVRIQEGDVVILPSLSGGVLGTIKTVISVPTEPEQRAYITYDIPLQSLRLVRVLTEPIVPISFEDAATIVRNTHAQLFKVDVPPDLHVSFGSTTGTTNVPGGSATNTSP